MTDEVKEVVEPKDANQQVEEVELVDPEPWPEEMVEQEPAEDESEQDNPDFGPDPDGEEMTVLDALNILEDLREESFSFIEIFDQVRRIHPRIELLLEKQRAKTDEKIDQIEDKLRKMRVVI